MPSGILGAFPPNRRLAVEGCAPAGCLSCGPLLHIRETGTYRIKFATSSPEDEDSPGDWKILLVNPNRWSPTTVAGTGAIEPGENKEVVVEVEVGKRRRGRAIECQIFYGGTGQLEMHDVEVTRIK